MSRRSCSHVDVARSDPHGYGRDDPGAGEDGEALASGGDRLPVGELADTQQPVVEDVRDGDGDLVDMGHEGEHPAAVGAATRAIVEPSTSVSMSAPNAATSRRTIA